jgi:hypothetical protein
MDNRLPPRYAFRLEDLRAWHVVRVSCRSCRHRAELAPAALTRSRPGYPGWSISKGACAAGNAGRGAGRRLRWTCGRGIEFGMAGPPVVPDFRQTVYGSAYTAAICGKAYKSILTVKPCASGDWPHPETVSAWHQVTKVEGGGLTGKPQSEKDVMLH